MTEPEKPRRRPEAAGVVAIVLAGGMAIALNIITIALLYAAIVRLGVDPDSGLSDNGVQVLLAWGGGIISVLAGYVGYIVGKRTGNDIPPPGVPKPVEKPKP
jgi:hypothetical protein